MAKKRFTDDLFGLFEDPEPLFADEATEEEEQGANGAGAKKQDKEKGRKKSAAAAADDSEEVEVEVPVRDSRAKKKLSSKKFTANLDAFLSQDIQRASGSPQSGSSSRTSAPAVPRRRRKAGLDLLIRSTVSKDQEAEFNTPIKKDTKRVTLVLKKDYVATLKEQAKDRKVYLRDVVQEMVAAYLAGEGEE